MLATFIIQTVIQDCSWSNHHLTIIAKYMFNFVSSIFRNIVVLSGYYTLKLSGCYTVMLSG